MIRWVFWFLASSGTAFACDVTGHQMGSDNTDAPKVYVAYDDIPVAQPFSMRVTVCNDSTINDLRVDAIMPAHRHGMNYTPQITTVGDGVFEVDDMLFHMPGVWEVQVNVAFDMRTELYTSDITLK
jgi:hypothetical protein